MNYTDALREAAFKAQRDDKEYTIRRRSWQDGLVIGIKPNCTIQGYHVAACDIPLPDDIRDYLSSDWILVEKHSDLSCDLNEVRKYSTADWWRNVRNGKGIRHEA